MLNPGMIETVLGRIWASPRIVEDFNAICATGGRFSGTASEKAAVEWLAPRLAEATGASVAREAIPYRGWSRIGARITDARGVTHKAEALGRSSAHMELTTLSCTHGNASMNRPNRGLNQNKANDRLTCNSSRSGSLRPVSTLVPSSSMAKAACTVGK